MEKFRITFEDYLSAQRLHLGWKRWLAPVIFLGVAAAFLVNGIFANSGEQSVILPVVQSVFFAAVAVLIIPMLQRRRFRKIYTSQKSLHEDVEVSFDDERIEWRSKSGRFESRWEDLHKFKVGKRVILLYESPNLMRPVMQSAFTGAHEEATFMRHLTKIDGRRETTGAGSRHGIEADRDD